MTIHTPFRPLLLCLLCLPWAASPAAAEQCACPKDAAAQQAKRASAVFEGIVVSVEPTGDGGSQALLRVTRGWRGALAETVRVSTAAVDACGLPLEADGAYLVYAHGPLNALRSGRCSGTRPVREADADLARLGAGSIPVDPPTEDPKRTRPAALPAPARAGCASCSVGAQRGTGAPAGILLAALVGLSGLALRRRTRS